MPKNYCEQVKKIFSQGLYDQSSTQKERLGTQWQLEDGRKFVYSKAGASNLAAGVMLASVATPAANDELVMTAQAAGLSTVTITLEGSDALTANQYAEGYLVTNKGTGTLGRTFKIKSHPAAAISTTCVITLYDTLPIINTNDECTLCYHPNAGLVIHPSPNVTTIAGVAPIDVTANYYFWAQVKGVCGVLASATVPIIGLAVMPSATVDGAVEVYSLNSVDASGQQPCVGYAMEVSIAGETSIILLDIPGY